MISGPNILQTIAAAIDTFARRETVASAWTTADWAKAPAEIANRSFFSAGVDSATWLSAPQRGIAQALDLSLDSQGRLPSREKFIADMRKTALSLGLGTPDQPANLKNIAGATRLGIVWDMNVQAARGRARRGAGLSEGALFAAPAQELVRGRTARIPRDWRARWAEAGEAISWQGALPFNGRFIALKTSPIWLKLSRFGTPWPPFDFGSGMILRNINRADAIALRLIEEDEVLSADPDPNFNAGLAATMQNVEPGVASALQSMLGNRIARDGNNLKWKDAA
jgi:hypothetical protein